MPPKLISCSCPDQFENAGFLCHSLGNDRFEAGGLSYAVIEPLKKVSMTFDGELMIVTELADKNLHELLEEYHAALQSYFALGKARELVRVAGSNPPAAR